MAVDVTANVIDKHPVALTRSQIASAVECQGLILLGIVDLAYPDDYARFTRWLADDKHAGMAFLERHRELRQNPAALLPGARAAIVVALPYHLGEMPAPRVAQYARFADYHGILRKRGEAIASLLSPDPAHFRVAVDTAPVLERALAAKSLDGFVGKNTCYIHPERGSFLLLAEILTTLDLPIDDKAFRDPRARTATEGCGSCTLCQVKCPTDALASDYTIDAKRCLAYWTIENRGPIPEMFWPWLAQYYYGCDICQTVCPYNHRATGNALPREIPERRLPSLFEVATMDQAAYEYHFGGTPMIRAKRHGLRRNALIAMVVTGDPRLSEALSLARGDAPFPIAETLFQIERYLERKLHTSPQVAENVRKNAGGPAPSH